MPALRDWGGPTARCEAARARGASGAGKGYPPRAVTFSSLLLAGNATGLGHDDGGGGRVGCGGRAHTRSNNRTTSDTPPTEATRSSGSSNTGEMAPSAAISLPSPSAFADETTRRVWCQSPKPEYKSEAQRYGVTSFVSLVSQSAATVCELTGRCAILQPQVCRRAASR